MKKQQKTTVLFIHVKTSMLDGVSLEIEKRADIFRKQGAQVYYLTGVDGFKRKEAFVIPEFAREHPQTEFLIEELFHKNTFDEDSMYALFSNLEFKMLKKIQRVLEKVQPEIIFVHNLFSHGANPLATSALIKALDEIRKPTIAVNHDFWFERPIYAKPRYRFLKRILNKLPYDRSYIRANQVINSIAGDEVIKRTGHKTELIGDYFDFKKPQPKKDKYNKDLLETLGIPKGNTVILHATRIVERKAIENAIRFAAAYEKKSKKPTTLLFPNYTENDTKPYQKKLDDLAKKLNVHVVWAEKHFAAERLNGRSKRYSFWDAYLFADLVTYTSTWEGFGNQFLEAVYFKKPIVLFEYPVFEKDIKPEGYKYISLGNKTTRRDGFDMVPDTQIQHAVDKAIELLIDTAKLKKGTAQNLKTANTNHGEHLLVDYIKQLVKNVRS